MFPPVAQTQLDEDKKKQQKKTEVQIKNPVECHDLPLKVTVCHIMELDLTQVIGGRKEVCCDINKCF